MSCPDDDKILRLSCATTVPVLLLAIFLDFVAAFSFDPYLDVPPRLPYSAFHGIARIFEFLGTLCFPSNPVKSSGVFPGGKVVLFVAIVIVTIGLVCAVLLGIGLWAYRRPRSNFGLCSFGVIALYLLAFRPPVGAYAKFWHEIHSGEVLSDQSGHLSFACHKLRYCDPVFDLLAHQRFGDARVFVRYLSQARPEETKVKELLALMTEMFETGSPESILETRLESGECVWIPRNKHSTLGRRVRVGKLLIDPLNRYEQNRYLLLRAYDSMMAVSFGIMALGLHIHNIPPNGAPLATMTSTVENLANARKNLEYMKCVNSLADILHFAFLEKKLGAIELLLQYGAMPASHDLEQLANDSHDPLTYLISSYYPGRLDDE